MYKGTPRIDPLRSATAAEARYLVQDRDVTTLDVIPGTEH